MALVACSASGSKLTIYCRQTAMQGEMASGSGVKHQKPDRSRGGGGRRKEEEEERSEVDYQMPAAAAAV